jgi:hypothetical protein
MVLVALGAVLATVGSLQTTSSSASGLCPSGTELIAKFEFTGGMYVFAGPQSNADVVTITNGTSVGGDWVSSAPIVAVIVKGGVDAVMTTYTPPQTGGHFTNENLPKVGSEQTPDISHVEFCGTSGGTATTTTTNGTTTTTGETTTTSGGGSSTLDGTTTTSGGTTSTVGETTTTSVGTTTTVGGTTTTSGGTTTTTAGETTTTTEDTTTTGATTTSAATTTSSVGTTTTIGGTTTTTSGSFTTTTVQVAPATAQPTTTITAVASSPSSSVAVLEARVSNDDSLPVTGARSVPLIVFGVGFVFAGLTLTVLGRARERRAVR